MLVQDLLAAASPIINGTLTPLMSVVFIPRLLREKNTGRYQGFNDIRLFHYLAGLALIYGVLTFSQLGVTVLSVFRVLISVFCPFVLAYILVKVSDARGWNIDYQIRKTLP